VTTHFGTVRRRAFTLSAIIAATTLVGCAGRHGSSGGAQLSRTYDQSYLPASHNWAFRRHYPRADRLFNAFDYGHAILSEVLYTRPGVPNAVLDRDQLGFITRQVLVHPPAVPLEESAIAPQFSRLVPEIEHVFEWAHMLHRQLYDVWADDRISDRAKDARIAELVAKEHGADGVARVLGRVPAPLPEVQWLDLVISLAAAGVVRRTHERVDRDRSPRRRRSRREPLQRDGRVSV
jgi:hypothetical protein